MRRMKGWTLCWQIIMESFRDTACIVCTFSLENIMKSEKKRSRIISGGIERTQSGTEKLCWLPREKQQAALVCFYGEEDVSKLLKYVKHSVVPACSVRLHDRGVFTWKECKGP